MSSDVPGHESAGPRAIKMGSLFKFAFLANLALFLPVMLFFGLIAQGGARVVHVNGQPVFGITALIVSIAMPFLIALAPALWIVIGTALLRLLGRRAPKLQFHIALKDGTEQHD